MSYRSSAVVAVLLTLLACHDFPAGQNRPPTIVITSGPNQALPDDTLLFSWIGSDVDGHVIGYEYSLDDSTSRVFTCSTSIRLWGVSPGRHVFYVRARDDSGAYSTSAAHPFRIRTLEGVSRRGTDTTFELATWNLREFPLQGDSTVSLVAELMLSLALDVYALQEISDTMAFFRLLSLLPGYTGIFSQDDYGSFYQKTGVVYRTSTTSVSNIHQLFWNNDSFPRPPLVMHLSASCAGQIIDFQLMVLHLKAGRTAGDRAKRMAACRALKAYYDSLLTTLSDSDCIVVGDWNDELDAPAGQNVFLPLLSDTLDYRFLTLPLAGNAHQASYIPSAALLDHIMVTTSMLPEYGTGKTTTIRLDDELPGYEGLISDHRPVMAVFSSSSTPASEICPR